MNTVLKQIKLFPVYQLALLLSGLLLLSPARAQAPQVSPDTLLVQLSEYPHAELVASNEASVLDHEIGLGAMQKVLGSWRFKSSERHSGDLQRFTWQIIDGFSSAEVLQSLELKLQENGASILFECEGRACGHGAQWANRVFGQRVLYGRDDLQRYRVYGLQGDTEYRLMLYAAARTADRQYLQVDLLQITPASTGSVE
jgi:hypothetical protein